MVSGVQSARRRADALHPPLLPRRCRPRLSPRARGRDRRPLASSLHLPARYSPPLHSFLGRPLRAYHPALVEEIAARFDLPFTRRQDIPAHFTLKYHFETP